jgi:hypothetical protein
MELDSQFRLSIEEEKDVAEWVEMSSVFVPNAKRCELTDLKFTIRGGSEK